MATSDFNAIAPITGYTVDTFPDSSALLYGTLHHLCNSEAERQLRNNVTYSAQGLNAGIDDKFEQYNRLAIYYKQMFDQKAQAYKMYANAQEAWGDSYSPYAIINQYLFRQ
ncbi:MAG: hypothetical protein LRY74_07585 [Shewanella xiamenensis]|nr:hypothetical protein [Shewanella xiamenensis]